VSVASLRQGNTEADDDMSSLDWSEFQMVMLSPPPPSY